MHLFVVSIASKESVYRLVRPSPIQVDAHDSARIARVSVQMLHYIKKEVPNTWCILMGSVLKNENGKEA